MKAYNFETSSNVFEIGQYTRLEPFADGSIVVVENRPDGFKIQWPTTQDRLTEAFRIDVILYFEFILPLSFSEL